MLLLSSDTRNDLLEVVRFSGQLPREGVNGAMPHTITVEDPLHLRAFVPRR